MGLFPQPFIDDLRLQANIVQVVQEYVPLKRAGHDVQGPLPVSLEKTPSFNVNPEKGFFHCFGCGVGGDVFKFLELHEKVGFQDAVRDARAEVRRRAARARPTAAATMRGATSALRESAAQGRTRSRRRTSASSWRRRPARARGSSSPSAASRRRRSSSSASATRRNSRDGLKQRLLKQGFAQGVLLQSGLVVQRESGEVVDRFRNRLMVPICRDTGSVIAFGGRQMDADQGGPKYLNSPETPIYSKGRTLYGLNLTKGADPARSASRSWSRAISTSRRCFSRRRRPAVASCGTALTPQQAQLLRRFTSKVVLSFDPDAAGQGAAVRSCELLVAEGFDVNVVVLDKGEDPDTFIRRKGGDQYRERLEVVAAVSGIPARSGGRGARPRTTTSNRRQFLGKMLDGRGADSGRRRARPVRGPDRAQGAGLRKTWCGRKSARRPSTGRRPSPRASCRRSGS